MISSKLINLYQSFSRKELVQLKKFVHSPYHNQHIEVTALFDYLYQYYEQGVSFLKKEVVFQHLYPKATYNDLKLRHTASYLIKVIEDYLIAKELRNTPGVKNQLLLSAYRKREMHKQFDQAVKAQTKTLSQSNWQHIDFHYQNYQLQHERYEFTTARSENTRHVLEQLTQAFDHYFIANKLKQACNVFSHKRVFQSELELDLLKEVVQHVDAHQLYDLPAIGMHYYTYLMLAKSSHEYYFLLKERISQQGHYFPPHELRDIYLLAINYCIAQLNAGSKLFLREAFELYREAIANKTLLKQGKLSPFAYKNVVAIGLKLNEHDWIEGFISNFKGAISDDEQQVYFAYNLAKLRFDQQAFKAAKLLLSELNVPDLFTNIDAKVIAIKSNYELNEYDYLEYLLQSFQQYIRRKEVMTYHKKNYSAFIQLTKKLMNLKPKTKQSLIQQIEAAEILTEREWLLQKANAAP